MIHAEAFANFWISYIQENSEIIQHWDDSTRWTKHVLHYDTMLKRIHDEFGALAEMEYRKIDLVIYAPGKYNRISYYDNSGTEDTTIPLGLMAAIEHENDYRMVFQEIRKLTELRTPLKVLITYPDENKQNETELAIRKKMAEGIEQSNHFFAENPKTEYLLIMGYKEQKSARWKCFKYEITEIDKVKETEL